MDRLEDDASVDQVDIWLRKAFEQEEFWQGSETTGRGTAPNQTNLRHIVEVLKRSPPLALETYPSTALSLVLPGLRDGWVFPLDPLEFMVIIGAELSTVKEVYALDPDAIRTRIMAEGNLLLNRACRSIRTNEDVIIFLAEMFPESAAQENRGDLPIDLLIQSRSSDKEDESSVSSYVFKVLLEKCPLDSKRSLRTFQHAFTRGHGLGVLEHLVDHFLANRSNLTSERFRGNLNFREQFTSSMVFDLERAKLLERLIPHQIYQINFDSQRWTEEAFVHIMDSLTNIGHGVECFTLCIPLVLLRTSESARVSLQNYLTATKARQIKLSCSAGLLRDKTNDILWLLAETLDGELNPNIELSLVQCMFVGATRLKSFMCKLRCSSVLFDSCSLLGGLEGQPEWNQLEWNRCFLQRVKLRFCPVAERPLVDLVSSLSQALAVTDLTIQFPYDQDASIDITQPVVDLLRRGAIQHLVLERRGSHLDMKSFAHALKGNESLRSIDFCISDGQVAQLSHVASALESTNTTLFYCRMISGYAFYRDDKIFYYTVLNRFGRRDFCRGDFASGQSLVGTLINVVAKGFLGGKYGVIDLIYGLLKESPSVWCNQIGNRASESNRKRKFGELKYSGRFEY